MQQINQQSTLPVHASQCIVYAAAGLPPDWLLPIVVDVGE